MHEKKFTIFGSHATKSAVERAAEFIFTACGLLAVVAVFSITLYMIISGTPALFKVGVPEILFGTVWNPGEIIKSTASISDGLWHTFS